jgi:hypothetical protein
VGLLAAIWQNPASTTNPSSLKKGTQLTANELNEYVNREGTWAAPIADLKIRVKVIDARQIFGRLELKITPLAGSGEAWAQNVTLDDKQ